jgi:hypothetical protein
VKLILCRTYDQIVDIFRKPLKYDMMIYELLLNGLHLMLMVMVLKEWLNSHADFVGCFWMERVLVLI